MLEEATGVECVRCLAEARDGNVGDLTTELPIVVQCKVGKRPSVWRALEEAVEAADEGSLPVAVVRRNSPGGRPAEDLAVLDLADFLRLLSAALRNHGNDAPPEGR